MPGIAWYEAQALVPTCLSYAVHSPDASTRPEILSRQAIETLMAPRPCQNLKPLAVASITQEAVAFSIQWKGRTHGLMPLSHVHVIAFFESSLWMSKGMAGTRTWADQTASTQ